MSGFPYKSLQILKLYKSRKVFPLHITADITGLIKFSVVTTAMSDDVKSAQTALKLRRKKNNGNNINLRYW